MYEFVSQLAYNMWEDIKKNNDVFNAGLLKFNVYFSDLFHLKIHVNQNQIK